MAKPRGPFRCRMRIRQSWTDLSPQRRRTVAFIDFGTSPSSRIELDQFPAFDEDEAWFWVDRWNSKRLTVLERCDPPDGYVDHSQGEHHQEYLRWARWHADPDRREEDEPPLPIRVLFHGHFGASPDEVEARRASYLKRKAERIGQG